MSFRILHSKVRLFRPSFLVGRENRRVGPFWLFPQLGNNFIQLRVDRLRFIDGKRTHHSQTAFLNLETARQNHDGQDKTEDHEQRTLQKLNPGRRHHSCRQHDDDHRRANNQDTHPLWKAKQRLDQDTRTNHLGNQIENTHRQGADSSGKLEPWRLKLRIQCIREGELTQPLHRLGNHKQGDNPTRKKTDGVEKAIVTVECNHPTDPEE